VSTAPYVFARLYGYMLGRTYRNTPDEACRDAITPYMIIVGIPSTLALLVLMSVLFPRLLLTKDWVPWFTVPAGVVLYLRFRSLRRYAQTPEIAAPFCSSRDRRITMIGYIGVLLGSILAAGIATRLLVTR